MSAPYFAGNGFPVLLQCGVSLWLPHDTQEWVISDVTIACAPPPNTGRKFGIAAGVIVFDSTDPSVRKWLTIVGMDAGDGSGMVEVAKCTEEPL